MDAAILAQLLAADFLPPVWMPDAATSALRRQRSSGLPSAGGAGARLTQA